MAFRSPTIRFAVGLLGFVGVAALAAPPALSQAPTAPELLSVNVVTVKPEMLRAYVDLQKSEIIPALQKGGQLWRSTWRSAAFGDPFMFAHVTPIKGFDQYDGPSPMVKALGQDGYQALLTRLRPMVTTQRTYALRTRPDLSYGTEGAAQPMAILTVIHVQPTKLLDFEGFIKGEWIPAMKKGGGKSYSVVQVLYGGGTTEFHTLVGLDKYADLASHPATKALGEDGVTKLMAKSGGFASSIERRVIRLDPDLSFQVKATTSK